MVDNISVQHDLSAGVLQCSEIVDGVRSPKLHRTVRYTDHAVILPKWTGRETCIAADGYERIGRFGDDCSSIFSEMDLQLSKALCAISNRDAVSNRKVVPGNCRDGAGLR